MSLAARVLRFALFPVPAGSGILTPGAISTITDNALYNAWPQVVLIANGSLLAAYVAANGHNTDNSGNIVGKISADGGASWGVEFTIADETLGAINPSLITLASGRVVCAYNLFNAPTTPAHAVRVRYSDDDGATWSSAYTVPDSFTSTVTNGTARLAQRGDGTVLLAVYGLDSGQTYYTARVLFSADNGATFGSETTIANGTTDSRQYYEPSVAVLDNADVLCLIRTSGGAGNMYQFRSTNGGLTWTNEGVAFGGYSPANVIQLPSRTLVATVRGNAAGKVEAFSSIDRGTTWVSQGILDASGYTEMEYACPVALPDRSILVVYSVQPTAAITNADVKQVSLTETA